MFVALGLTFLGIGSIGVVSSVVLEIKKREPIYMLLMKIFPWFMAIGAIMMATGGF